MSSMKIMVMNTVQASMHGAGDLMHRVDMDQGPLAMPMGIRIGAQSVMSERDGSPYKIMSYADQLAEYDMWLEYAIKMQNKPVLIELDRIFGLAQTGGVILTTNCLPSPYWTHAHIVMRTINKLAGEPEANDTEAELQQRSEEGA